MSEEVRDASKIVPNTIIGGMWFNAIMLLIMGVTFVFTMGDATEILDSPIGVPFIQVFLNATGSYAATNIMTVIIAITLISACFSEVATVSRQIWSFARDKGTLSRSLDRTQICLWYTGKSSSVEADRMEFRSPIFFLVVSGLATIRHPSEFCLGLRHDHLFACPCESS